MRAWLQSIRESIGVRDVFVFGGLALLSVGAGMVYLPAAPIVAGLALLVIGLNGVPTWR